MKKKYKFDKIDFLFIGINIVAAIIILFLCFLLLKWGLKKYTQHGVEIEVIDIRGKDVNEAKLLLSGKDLKMEVIDSTYIDTIPLGAIIEQDPVPNSMVKNGRIIYVTVNASIVPKVTMPDLQDISYRQAEVTLNSLGLIVDSEYDYEPSAFRDIVLDVKSNDISILPGTRLPIGTKVRLVVGFGTGTEDVEVPNLLGMTLTEARNTARNSRLTIGAITYDEPDKTEEPQYIYRQTPNAGETVKEGEAVALYFSTDKGKAATELNLEDNDEENWF